MIQGEERMKAKNYARALTISLLVLLINDVIVNAQGPPRGRPGFEPPERREGRGPGQGRPHPPGNPMLDYFPFESPAQEKVVKGAPFTATAQTERLQVLSDGTRISNKMTATLYRDGEGRTRREMTLSVIGPFTIVGEPPRLAFINDFVAGVHYIVNVQQREARKIRLGDLPPPPPDTQGKSESLGKQMIEGLEAEGTRMTVTIPTGQIGNDRPIEIVTERWESTALKTILLSNHRDPRVGETTYRLININRSEPAHTLFEVPGDYRILPGPPHDGRPGGPPNGPPMGPPRGQGRRPGGAE
jgi:hypothetical protein